MSTQNTRIAKSRFGGIRLPHESPSVGNGYAASGPVKTYYMTPEEIAAKYPAKPKGERKKAPAFIWRNKQKEADDLSRLDIARVKLTRGMYVRARQDGMVDKDIMQEYFEANNWGDVLNILKKEWAFTPEEKLSMMPPPERLQDKMEKAATEAVNQAGKVDIGPPAIKMACPDPVSDLEVGLKGLKAAVITADTVTELNRETALDAAQEFYVLQEEIEELTSLRDEKLARMGAIKEALERTIVFI